MHSGSRGFGERILRQHVDQFSHQGLREDTEEFAAYLRQHNQALLYARLNRELIARRMLERLAANGEPVLDVNHNLVAPVAYQGQSCWIHRKGATPADQGLVMIPGSRGDYSYLVTPKPTAASLYSLAHGAGRKWMRSDCKGRLSPRYRAEQLERTALGSRVICKDKALLYEEAPEAYKAIDSVIDAMLQADLITVVARFKPVLTYKTQGGCK
ncbi:RNA ligase RtcB family protein [Alkalilimnicola ehrlichii]|uniref:RNA ligase RtcB family protein n=1 Tax=Alkalilimnicola ehrlichii TaxID=351052 RepID=UPI002868EAC1|nr:RNA ligase RtcB family protein [Alkalilimnicola ehrlichii]